MTLPEWSDIPTTVLAAYQRSAASLAKSDPACHLPVALLAAIGEVESGQADDGAVDSSGTTLQPIVGPVLDGSDGYAAIRNTYGTQWGQNGPWARAVGPMQFIPSTWAVWGGGGDPSNVYAAALAAGRYLCADGQDLSTAAGLSSAIESYNDSAQYLAAVLQWMNVYSGGIVPVADALSMIAPDTGSTSAAAALASGPKKQAAPAAAPAPASKPAPKPKPASTSTGKPAPAPSSSKTPAPTSTAVDPVSAVKQAVKAVTGIASSLLPSSAPDSQSAGS
jgi:hypothetical protein